MTTYTIAFPKGGSTKTATAAELASILAARGRKVLAIDLDEQASLSERFGFTENSDVPGTVAEVLTGRVKIHDAVAPSPSIPGIFMLVGGQDLRNVNILNVRDLVTALRDLLPTVKDDFDDIVIDTPPALAELTLAGLAAAEVLISPLVCETEAFAQINRFETIIEEQLSARIRPGLKIDALIPTRYDGRRKLDRDIVETIKELYGDRINVTEPIREGVAVRDAFTAGLPVSLHAPDSKPAQDYLEVLTKIVEEVR